MKFLRINNLHLTAAFWIDQRAPSHIFLVHSRQVFEGILGIDKILHYHLVLYDLLIMVYDSPPTYNLQDK
jgi:hypothetical protein